MAAKARSRAIAGQRKSMIRNIILENTKILNNIKWLYNSKYLTINGNNVISINL